MPSVNQLSTFSSNLHRKYIAEARYTNQVSGLWVKTVINETLPEGQGSNYNWPKYSTFTAASATDGTPVSTAQVISTSNVQLTPSEIYVMWLMTKKSIAQASENVAKAAGNLAANAIQLKIDQDGVALFSGYSQTVAGSGVSPTGDHILSSWALIMGNSTEVGIDGNGRGGPGGAGSLTSMLHPFSYRPIASDLTGYGVTGMQAPMPEGPSAMILKNATMGSLHGTNVVINPNITVSSSNAQNGVYGRNSAMICWWNKFTEESQHDVTLRGDVSVVTADYAVAELVDSWGTYMLASASTPT